MGQTSQYIETVQEGIRFYLQQNIDRDMLHQVRVHIKKLRALWLIHPLGNTIPFNKIFPGLHKLFKSAAATRDLQMVQSCLQTLSAYPKQADLDKKLLKGIEKEINTFSKQLEQKKFRYTIARDLHSYVEYFKVSSTYILDKNRKKFKDELSCKLHSFSLTDETMLHDLRRQVKYFVYQSDAYHLNTADQKLLLYHGSLENFQHHLGIWHDWWNAREYLKRLKLKGHLHILETLIQQAARKENMLKREVLREIKLLVSKPINGKSRSKAVNPGSLLQPGKPGARKAVR